MVGRRKRGGAGEPGAGTKRTRQNTYTYDKESDKMESAKFSAFYREQKIVGDDEWETFIESLRSPLPTTFRINNAHGWGVSFRDMLQEHFFAQMEDLVIDGEKVNAPKAMHWYPDSLAFSYSVSRPQIRKAEVLQAFRTFLMVETARGNISRQEAVSMVPPLFLGVQGDDLVLDICASPGSKTAQILEMMKADKDRSGGVVIANDADRDRCYMLLHQMSRIYPENLIVTNHDGQCIPTLRKDGAPILFDRILADVPCSGDGTIRKAPGIWKKWHAGLGQAIHPVQLKILLRAIEMVKPGGTVVYSTCSMSPYEDEAVVAEALTRCNGAVELVDTSDMIPQLKRRPGLLTWKVFVGGKFFSSFKELAESDVNTARAVCSLFPPEDGEALRLDRCMRFLPHDQDTGGFFVAVLRKTGAVDASIHRNRVYDPESDRVCVRDENEVTNAPTEKESAIAKKKKKNYAPEIKNEQYRRVREANPAFFKDMCDFYRFSDDFDCDSLVTVSVDGNGAAYVVSKETQEILNAKGIEKLKIAGVGTRVFVPANKRDPEFAARICSQGGALAAPYLPERTIDVSLRDAIKLLKRTDVPYSELEEKAQRALEDIRRGSALIRYQPTEEDCKKEERNNMLKMMGEGPMELPAKKKAAETDSK